MRPLLDFSDLPRSEHLSAFEAVALGRASSRRDLGRLLGLRSTSISEIVADLLDSRLLVEAAGPKLGRGRPAAVLHANAAHFGAVVFQVVSQSLRAVATNIAGQVVAEHSILVPPDSGNAALTALFRDLHRRAVADLPAQCTRVANIFVLPGLLRVDGAVWSFSSRWPQMRDLDMATVLDDPEVPVIAHRNLDIELAARLDGAALKDSAGPKDGAALLVHWGYGIGAAFAVEGAPWRHSARPFGEVGHWRLGDRSGRTCVCGNDDCLETVAAIWSLVPRLRDRWPDLPVEEPAFADAIAQLPILEHPQMDQALGAFTRVLANLCRILFPDRVIVTGPFSANAAIWAEVHRRFTAAPLLRGVPFPTLEAERRSADLEIRGALAAVARRTVLDRLERFSDGAAAGAGR